MDDLSKSYQLFGLQPGCTFEEVKQTYRDLVNVWHPDRFAHDDRLRQVAQEKLKDINGAYELLKASFFELSIQPQPAVEEADPAAEAAPAQTAKNRSALWVILLLLLASAAVGGLFYAKKYHGSISEGADAKPAKAAAAKSPAEDKSDGAHEPPQNVLTAAEALDGWTLLFNGKNLNGWRVFKKKSKPGWRVDKGTIVSNGKQNVNDLITGEQYKAFELQLDYKLKSGGNSGILYHVTNDGDRPEDTGLKMQLRDNAADPKAEPTGSLHELYEPTKDSKTGKLIDATNPPGEWNHVRLLVTPDRCEHEINGVKYFYYAIGSADFLERMDKSKLSALPLLAKSPTGFVALEAGAVAFRNIKLRVITDAE